MQYNEFIWITLFSGFFFSRQLLFIFTIVSSYSESIWKIRPTDRKFVFVVLIDVFDVLFCFRHVFYNLRKLYRMLFG